MTNIKILKQVMTYTTLNQLYNEYCNRLLEIPSNVEINLTLISSEEFTNIIDFLFTNYDEDEYYFEEVYDMRTKESKPAYITADLQIDESEYKEMENKSFLLECVDEDNYEITIDTQKKYDSYIALMPICFKEFYQYCKEFLYKKEKELDEKIEKEFPKNKEIATKNEEIVVKDEETIIKNETNYRKIAEEFLKNYDSIINSYESLSKIINNEQLVDIFEIIFKNFGE